MHRSISPIRHLTLIIVSAFLVLCDTAAGPARGAGLDPLPPAALPAPIAQPPPDPRGVEEQNGAIGVGPTYVDQMIALVNAFRAENGVPPLKASPALGQAGQDFAARMATRNFFGHADPDAGCNTPWERAMAAGYLDWESFGENIAAGFPAPESAFAAFKASPPHRATMLNPAFREIGAGYFFEAHDAANVRQAGACPYTELGGPYRYYWTQEFGARALSGMPHLPIIIDGEAFATVQRQVTIYVHGGSGPAPWAQQMRFSDDGVTWAPFEPWAATHTHTLPPGSGFKMVYAQITDGRTTQTVSDMIYLDDAAEPGRPIIARVYVPIARR